MLLLVEHKKVIIVGIPGVGKTSLVTTIVEKLSESGIAVSVHSYGTLMFEEAKNFGVKDRDELRRLPVEKQKELQKNTAEKIAVLTDDIVFIDSIETLSRFLVSSFILLL